MGKYPKFNVINACNTKCKEQNCENYFSGSQGMSKEWLQGVAAGHSQMSFCMSASPLLNHPTTVLNSSNSNHVGVPPQHRGLFTPTLMHCLSHNTSLKYFFILEISSSILSKEMYLCNPLLWRIFMQDNLVWSSKICVYNWDVFYMHVFDPYLLIQNCLSFKSPDLQRLGLLRF